MLGRTTEADKGPPHMYKHTNGASRLHAFLSKVLQQQDQAMFLALASVFSVKGTDERGTAQLVVTRLHWFFSELDLLEAQVQALRLSPHLYEGAFARVRMVFSPLNIGAGWQGVRGNLTPDVLLAFAFLNELLPDEETAIPQEELLALVKAATDLQAQLQSSALPDPLRRLIEHHIQLILLGLAQYPIQGAKALREVARTAVGEIIEAKGSVVVPPNTDEVSKLERLWKHLNTAVDIAQKAEKMGQLGQRAVELLQSLGQ